MASRRSARLCSASTPAAAAAAATQEHPLPHDLRNISHNQPEKKQQLFSISASQAQTHLSHSRVHSRRGGGGHGDDDARRDFISQRNKKKKQKNNRRRGGCSNKGFSSPTGGLKREERTHRRKIKIYPSECPGGKFNRGGTADVFLPSVVFVQPGHRGGE